MTRFNRMLLPALCAALLAVSGCSSSDEDTAPAVYEPPAPVINLKGHTKDVRVGTRDLTLEYIANTRYGAGIEQGSYKHVLAQADYAGTDSPMLSGRVRYDRAHQYEGVKYTPIEVQLVSAQNAFPRSDVSSDGNPQSCSPYFATLADFKLGKSADYSPAELDVWQKFCDCGRGMTSGDWAFVRSHAEAFPFELKETCRPPEYEALRSNGLAADRDALYRQAFGGARKGSLK